jgi:hypothetical protein
MVGMAEEKKRLPWRLLACAVALLIAGLTVGFIETIGRQGTIVGRYERIKDGMKLTEVLRILGPPLPDNGTLPQDMGQMQVWAEGPMYVIMAVDDDRGYGKDLIENPPEKGERHVWWHLRRWAEQVCTAIHGPPP